MSEAVTPVRYLQSISHIQPGRVLRRIYFSNAYLQRTYISWPLVRKSVNKNQLRFFRSSRSAVDHIPMAGLRVFDLLDNLDKDFSYYKNELSHVGNYDMSV